MRILLTPIGSFGDNLPFIGLGRELARRGHDVTVAAAEPFAELAERLGMQAVHTASHEEYRLATDEPELFHPTKGYTAVMARVCEYNRRLFDVVMRHGADVVVAHSLDFSSPAIGEKTGLPVTRLHLQPSILRTIYRVPVMSGTTDCSFLPIWTKRFLWRVVDRTVLDPPLAPAVNELRGRLGLAPVRRVLATQLESPRLTLGMFPEWYAPRQPDWPATLEQCDFPLFDAAEGERAPPPVEEFLDGGDAPIVFTPGSAMRFGHRFFEAAVGACERLGRRGVLLTRHREQVPAPLPSGVACFDYAPLSAVLPRAAALVHHGGIGTTAAAFAAGIPQLIVPFSHDQPDNAHRVVGLGAGRRVMPRRFSTPRVARELDALLGSSETLRRCREIGSRVLPGRGVARACDLLERAVRQV